MLVLWATTVVEETAGVSDSSRFSDGCLTTGVTGSSPRSLAVGDTTSSSSASTLSAAARF